MDQTAKLLDLKRRVEHMSAADKLRLCAGLIDQGEYEIAETLTDNVVTLLRARRLLGWKSTTEPK